uniref:Uncharacterized protein n=1 Tax=Glossina brevipalpis TaxID=37001 RepID=A0A1A9WHU8_9MUSC
MNIIEQNSKKNEKYLPNFENVKNLKELTNINIQSVLSYVPNTFSNMLGDTFSPIAKIYNGINAKLREEINCPLCPEGKFCAILNAFKISMVAFIKASRASATLEVSDRSTAILDNKPIIASISAACISSGSEGVTGKHRVCTRMRRSPSLLVYRFRCATSLAERLLGSSRGSKAPGPLFGRHVWKTVIRPPECCCTLKFNTKSKSHHKSLRQNYAKLFTINLYATCKADPKAEPGSWVSAKRFGSCFNKSLTSSLHSFKLTSKLSGRVDCCSSDFDASHLVVNGAPLLRGSGWVNCGFEIDDVKLC